MEEKEIILEETEVLTVIDNEEDVTEETLKELSNNKGEEEEENE